MSLRCDDFTPAFPISPLVIVGVCAAGKSTLAGRLRQRGIAARAVAQEHSQVLDLYRRSGRWVVLLTASWASVHRRRKLSWNPAFYREEWRRLTRARQDAVLVIGTDWLDADEVADETVAWFDRRVGFAAWFDRDGITDPALRAQIRSQFRPNPGSTAFDSDFGQRL
jgi:hypothetical protein